MPRHLIDVRSGMGWLDIGSYARYGPGRRDRPSPAQIEVIARTVHRTPWTSKGKEARARWARPGLTDLAVTSVDGRRDGPRLGVFESEIAELVVVAADDLVGDPE
jgi:hypothetical protein